LAGKSKDEMWVWSQLYLFGPKNASAFQSSSATVILGVWMWKLLWVWWSSGRKEIQKQNGIIASPWDWHIGWAADLLGLLQLYQEQCRTKDSEGQHEYPFVYSGCWQHVTCRSEGTVGGWQADGMMGLLHFCSQVIAYYIGKYWHVR